MGAAVAMDKGLTTAPDGRVAPLTPPLAVTAEVPASPTNMTVIHQAAQGSVDLAAFGRVTVTAKPRDGLIDLTVAASKQATATLLLPHAAAISADVRAIDVTVGKLDIGHAPSAPSATTGGPSTNGDDAAPRRDRDSGAGASPETSDEAAGPGAGRARVRIVL